MPLTTILTAVLQGWKLVVRASFPNLILRPVLLCAGVWGATRLHRVPEDGSLVLAFNAFAFFVCLLVLAWWAVRKAPVGVRTARPRSSKSEWNRTAASMLLISGVHLVLSQTDTIMVGILVNPTESGYYWSAGRLAGLVVFGLVAASAVVAPAISTCYSRGDTQRLQAIFDEVSKWVLAFAIFVSIALIVGGRLILGLWGESFVGAYSVLVVLVIANLINAWAGPVGFLMTMTGRQNVAAWVMGICAVLNILLNFLLIPLFGMVGASIATATSMSLSSITLVVYAKKYLGVRTMIQWPKWG
jgi:O-antigen/teichoic acid export membrane protein